MALTAKEILNTSYTDDMPEYISIFDKPQNKRGTGRPKLYNTPEELAESYRVSSNKYHKLHYLEYKDAKNLRRKLRYQEKKSAEKEKEKVK
jgi:hypothetical protein